MSGARGKGRRKQVTTIVEVGGRPVAIKIRELVLEVVSGPDAGAQVVLDRRQLAIGSNPANDLVLTDPAASRFHAKLRADDAGYRLIDSGSTNGTRVNGVRIRDAYLADGARIEIGETAIGVTFRAEESVLELSADEQFGEAVGRSVVMGELFAMARRAARSQSTVLLLGETGTGKDLIARAIHDHSPRAAGPFVVLDCGGVSESLIESELFGHVRGAFTGAEADRAGVFERASGGTLFIDEVGELPLALQPKLLRAIESRVITRVGDAREVPVDVRIIAATNRDLDRMVERDEFRPDLYYRLAIVPLEVPPLRDRPEDIPLIAGHLLRDLFAQSGTDPAVLRQHFDEAFGALKTRRWPGNVRELRNALERAVALASPEEMARDGLAQLVALRGALSRTLREPLPLEAARAQFDREYLRDALAAAGGDIKRAAEIADVHPKSFSRLLRRYGVDR